MKKWYAVKYLGEIVAIQQFTDVPALMEFDFMESYNDINDYEIIEAEVLEIIQKKICTSTIPAGTN